MLGESKSLKWSRDVDFNDQKLKELHEKYQKHLSVIATIGLELRSGRFAIIEDLQMIEDDLTQDLGFMNKS